MLLSWIPRPLTLDDAPATAASRLDSCPDIADRCRAPSLLRVMSHANRLLGFKPPAQRIPDAHIRLIAPTLTPTRRGEADCSQWPPALRDETAQRLWRLALGTPHESAPDTADQALTLLLLAQETRQFDPRAWAAQEIAQLADGASFSAVHSGRYLAENFDRASLSAILQAHGYHAPYLEAFNDPAIGWLAARWLSYPLPWRALLEALTSDDRARAALAPFSRLIWLLDMITRDAPIEKITWDEALQRADAAQDTGANETPSFVRPVRKLILVEGVTETLVLPAFARALGLSLSGAGAFMMAAGGKKPLARLYEEYAPITAGPIAALLDNDARDGAQALQNALRPQDTLIILSPGEMEDAYPLALMLRALNQELTPSRPLSESDWQAAQAEWRQEKGRSPRTVETLQALWKRYGLEGGTFDKARFAQAIAAAITGPQDVPGDVRRLFSALGLLGA
ncbi:MAG: ATP-dependent endonuclease [Vampirovibrionales bacterium]|nr:ATP-dependent endonuclease [Vampirovibrionales bacterium]